MFVVRNSVFRRLILSIFRKINPGDITIKHHWVPSKKVNTSFYQAQRLLVAWKEKGTGDY